MQHYFRRITAGWNCEEVIGKETRGNAFTQPCPIPSLNSTFLNGKGLRLGNGISPVSYLFEKWSMPSLNHTYFSEKVFTLGLNASGFTVEGPRQATSIVSGGCGLVDAGSCQSNS